MARSKLKIEIFGAFFSIFMAGSVGSAQFETVGTFFQEDSTTIVDDMKVSEDGTILASVSALTAKYISIYSSQNGISSWKKLDTFSYPGASVNRAYNITTQGDQICYTATVIDENAVRQWIVRCGTHEPGSFSTLGSFFNVAGASALARKVVILEKGQLLVFGYVTENSKTLAVVATTSDFGKNWETVSKIEMPESGVPSASFERLSAESMFFTGTIIENGDEIIFGMYTSDAGKTWKMSNFPVKYGRFPDSSSDIGVGVISGHIYLKNEEKEIDAATMMTFDGGAVWTLVDQVHRPDLGRVNYFRHCSIKGDFIAVAGVFNSEELWVSRLSLDGGKTWQTREIWSGSESEGALSTAAVVTGDGVVYYGGLDDKKEGPSVATIRRETIE